MKLPDNSSILAFSLRSRASISYSSLNIFFEASVIYSLTGVTSSSTSWSFIYNCSIRASFSRSTLSFIISCLISLTYFLDSLSYRLVTKSDDTIVLLTLLDNCFDLESVSPLVLEVEFLLILESELSFRELILKERMLLILLFLLLIEFYEAGLIPLLMLLLLLLVALSYCE